MSGHLNEIVKALRDGLHPCADKEYAQNCLSIIATHLDWLTDLLYSEKAQETIQEMKESRYNQVLNSIVEEQSESDEEDDQ